ncbi:Uncharacterised protein [Nocardia otitidiscaviarum]|uniref:Mce-associated membrane protein n=1 Tax=Nocardia otitidiscaviarum TaxID=1823 RepID=A0A378YA27_9NOCA|nr:hypothetical protein [Nocardia otitidiscaviarum]SUA73593.1 Uncharacterised protein [Nocardia otitidiscaviarum]
MSQQNDSESVDRSARTGVTVAAVALLAVAAVAAAWFGYAWIVGGLVQDNGRADARDTALNDARQAAVNLMTFDPDDVDGSLRTMLSSTTGALREEQTKDLDSLKSQVAEARTRMRSEVEGATITSLASENDRATAFVVLRITRAWPGGQPATFRQLWNLDMVKEGDTWKAEQARNLGEPVSLDAGALPTEPAPTEQPPSGDQPQSGEQPQSGDQPESAEQQPTDQQPQAPGR